MQCLGLFDVAGLVFPSTDFMARVSKGVLSETQDLMSIKSLLFAY